MPRKKGDLKAAAFFFKFIWCSILRVVVFLVFRVLVFQFEIVFGGPTKFATVRGERGEHHINATSHHFWFSLHGGHRGQIGFDALHQFITQFLVCHFASTKLQLSFNFVSLIEKFLGSANLRHVIVVIDIDPKFNFLEFAGGRLFVFFLLGDFITIYAEIDDTTNRWNGIGSDLDEVESGLLSQFDGVGKLKNAKLLIS